MGTPQPSRKKAEQQIVKILAERDVCDEYRIAFCYDSQWIMRHIKSVSRTLHSRMTLRFNRQSAVAAGLFLHGRSLSY